MKVKDQKSVPQSKIWYISRPKTYAHAEPLTLPKLPPLTGCFSREVTIIVVTMTTTVMVMMKRQTPR